MPAAASFINRSIATCLMYYKEAQNGQILEEGITEAGAMASFTAAGTAYANVRRADRFPSLFTIRCSVSSALEIWSGLSPTRAARAS